MTNKKIEITKTPEGNGYILTINDKMSLSDYIKLLEEEDQYGLYKVPFLNLIRDKHEMVIPGVVYIYLVENGSYHFMIADDKVKIEEFIQEPNGIKETSITLNADGSKKIYQEGRGSLKSLPKYYPKFPIKDWEMAEEEANKVIETVCTNMQKIAGIENILDFETIKSSSNDKKSVVKEPIEISMNPENDGFIVKMNKPLTLNEYTEIMNRIDTLGIKELISMSVLHTKRTNNVNSGVYFIFLTENGQYTVLKNSQETIIQELITTGDITEEKIITIDSSNNYNIYQTEHLNGDTLDSKFYPTAALPVWLMTDEEAHEILDSVFAGLAKIPGSNNIGDIFEIKSKILNQTTTKVGQK